MKGESPPQSVVKPSSYTARRCFVEKCRTIAFALAACKPTKKEAVAAINNELLAVTKIEGGRAGIATSREKISFHYISQNMKLFSRAVAQH